MSFILGVADKGTNKLFWVDLILVMAQHSSFPHELHTELDEVEVDHPLLELLQQVVLLHGQLDRALGQQVLEAHAQLVQDFNTWALGLVDPALRYKLNRIVLEKYMLEGGLANILHT